MISAVWVCVGDRLPKAPGWKVADPPVCLTGGGAAGANSPGSEGPWQPAWVPGHVLLEGGVRGSFRVCLGGLNCGVFTECFAYSPFSGAKSDGILKLSK